MRPEEKTFCQLINIALHPEDANETSIDTATIRFTLPKLIALATKHNTLLLLYDALCNCSIPLDSEQENFFKNTVIAYSYGSYNMLSFTRKILDMLEGEEIPYYLLKGASLLGCYPKFECRRYGDVDILISNSEEFERAKKYFLSHGFHSKNDLVDHHIELLFHQNGRDYLLELHSKVIASVDSPKINKKLLEIYHNPPRLQSSFETASLKYTTLFPTENALYLLLHMLQHFISSGFGIKLLCDWTVYLETNATAIHMEKFCLFLNELGLIDFCSAMTSLCIQHLGLSKKHILPLVSTSQNKAFLENLLDDILTAGEFGKNDASRMLIMTQSGIVTQYLHEFHRQMKNRFQKLHKIPVLWPILWAVTGICFLWNNHFLRKTSTSEIIKNSKKRQKLLHSLNVFRK